MRLPALALALPLAAALRVTNIEHSGSACPAADALSTTVTNELPVLRVFIPGLSAAVEARNITVCTLTLTIDEGEVGQALVLESVEVWGRLGLGEGSRGRLMTDAFWSANAEVVASGRTNTSTTEPFDEYIYVPSSVELPSGCVEDDGHVGILTIGFRVMADEGTVTFGPHQVGDRTVGVTEHLGLRWEECGE